MILDSQLLLSSAQAVTADAASTNVYDLGVAARDVAAGEALGIGVFVSVAADGTTTDETYTFIARTSAAAALTSPVDVGQVTVAYATLVAGYKFFIPLSHPQLLRYVGLYYDVGGTTPTITATAYIMPQSFFQNWKAYADGITIS